MCNLREAGALKQEAAVEAIEAALARELEVRAHVFRRLAATAAVDTGPCSILAQLVPFLLSALSVWDV